MIGHVANFRHAVIQIVIIVHGRHHHGVVVDRICLVTVAGRRRRYRATGTTIPGQGRIAASPVEWQKGLRLARTLYYRGWAVEAGGECSWTAAAATGWNIIICRLRHTHPIVPFSVVDCESSVGSQDSSRLIDKYSGSRATITLYQAPLTRVSNRPQRPPDIIVAVVILVPQQPADGGRFFSIPDSTIMPPSSSLSPPLPTLSSTCYYGCCPRKWWWCLK